MERLASETRLFERALRLEGLALPKQRPRREQETGHGQQQPEEDDKQRKPPVDGEGERGRNSRQEEPDRIQSGDAGSNGETCSRATGRPLALELGPRELSLELGQSAHV